MAERYRTEVIERVHSDRKYVEIWWQRPGADPERNYDDAPRWEELDEVVSRYENDCDVLNLGYAGLVVRLRYVVEQESSGAPWRVDAVLGRLKTYEKADDAEADPATP